MSELLKTIDPCPRCAGSVHRLVPHLAQWRAEPCGHDVAITVEPATIRLIGLID